MYSGSFLRRKSEGTIVCTHFFLNIFSRVYSLFPTYGFVYGDFSERTSVLLGGHQVVDMRVVSEITHSREQKNEIIVYLQQDDGYKVCKVWRFRVGYTLRIPAFHPHFVLPKFLLICDFLILVNLNFKNLAMCCGR